MDLPNRPLYVLLCLVFSSCFYHPAGSVETEGGDTASDDTATLTGADPQDPTGPDADTTGPTCGDGIVDLGEGCDDGNRSDDDDCNNMCVAPGCGDGEPGVGEECDDGNRSDADACSNACTQNVCGDGLPGPDETCDDGQENGDDKACTLECKEARCGDGKIQVGVESCDDGNLVDEDACTSQCMPNQCGDGVVGMNEQCDEGGANADTAACTSTCKLAECGDGLTYAGVEQCDDGNAIDTDACTNACNSAGCGDGMLGPDEECDLGVANSDSAACTTMCKDAECGDGLTQTGVEQCDDGNEDQTDGCPACQDAKCGDGFVHAGVEVCDGGDDCDATCKIKTCGNGLQQPLEGEECDDGNYVDGDTCSQICARTAFIVFVTQAKFDGDFGGLHGADALCSAAAAASQQPGDGSYRAWLSGGFESAANRLDHSLHPYIRPDLKVVADDWGDLTDGSLENPINITENGVTVGNGQDCFSSESLVWTNTNAHGEVQGNDHCQDWTTSNFGQDGRAGVLTSFNDGWTNKCDIECNKLARLYCIEQP